MTTQEEGAVRRAGRRRAGSRGHRGRLRDWCGSSQTFGTARFRGSRRRPAPREAPGGRHGGRRRGRSRSRRYQRISADPLSPAQVVARVLDRFGRLDVVVNNAAVIRTGSLDDITPELVDHHYAVNVRGPLLLVKAALPALRESPDAAIVNISSSVGSIVKPGNMLYGSTKAALEYLTRAWAYELAEDRIRVNCIAPGPVDTPIHATYSTDLAATYSRSRPAGASAANGPRRRHRNLDWPARNSSDVVDHRQCSPRGWWSSARGTGLGWWLAASLHESYPDDS